MSKTSFPNHSGGVVQVQHDVRWGSVPEALLEDDRLSLDSRAVAAWLAIKPRGWLIVVPVLVKRMRLGKDRWQRIARELEAAGYLSRSCGPGANGRWQWSVVFNPNPAGTGFTGAGFPGSGEIDSGPAVDGPPGAAEHGDKVVPLKHHHHRNTTTRVVAAVPELKLHFPAAAQLHKPMLQDVLSKSSLPQQQAQEIVDEFSGVFEASARGEHEVIRSPRAWVKRLVDAALAGEFTLDWGRHQRQATVVSAAVLASSSAAEAAAATQRAAAGLPSRQSSEEALAAIRNRHLPGAG
jgi:hypothetical protein